MQLDYQLGYYAPVNVNPGDTPHPQDSIMRLSDHAGILTTAILSDIILTLQMVEI